MRTALALVLLALVIGAAEVLTEQPWWVRMIASAKRRAKEFCE
jgi:hypothetical protein